MHTRQSAAANPQDKSNVEPGGLWVPYPDVIHSTEVNLPPDPENMNDLRAVWADDMLASFEQQHGDNGEHLQNLAGLLNYFSHWCDRNGFQLTKALQMAATRYRDETDGKGQQFGA